MYKYFAAVAVVATIALTSPAANAQERLGDAALGAVSGAVVAGPVGAIAGGLVGLTAGPTIARSWGVHRHYRYRRYSSARAVHTSGPHCRDC
jgi:hypothetical protein